MPKPLVVLGSARSDGETRRAIEIAFPDNTAELIILSELAIGEFDYEHAHAADDFLSVVDKMLAARVIVLATPVYWYAMSGPMKTFFDRLTDLLQTAKEKGRALAGRNLCLLATGTDDELPDGFEVPFRRTAAYFGMAYRGAQYFYTGSDNAKRTASEGAAVRFGQSIR